VKKVDFRAARTQHLQAALAAAEAALAEGGAKGRRQRQRENAVWVARERLEAWREWIGGR
jgi:hypothetical protein